MNKLDEWIYDYINYKLKEFENENIVVGRLKDLVMKEDFGNGCLFFDEIENQHFLENFESDLGKIYDKHFHKNKIFINPLMEKDKFILTMVDFKVDDMINSINFVKSNKFNEVKLDNKLIENIKKEIKEYILQKDKWNIKKQNEEMER